MKEKYLKEVLKILRVDKKTKVRIEEDLRVSLDAEEELFTYEDIVKRFGTPEEMAFNFMNNMEYPNEYYGVTIGLSRRAKPIVYKSKKKLFGLPLVDINISGRYGVGKAKGIIAIGDLAVGLVSIGGISVGLLSIGGLSLGILSLGGIAAGLIALGGITAGHIAIGGIAVGTYKVFGVISKLLV